MKYFDTIKAGATFLILFSVFFSLFPNVSGDVDVNIIITIGTFLFAILAGFFISRLSGRYDKMRDEMADEDAFWVAIFRLGQMRGNRFSEKIASIIDDYYIMQYDNDLGQSYQSSENDVLRIYKELERVKNDRGLISQTVVDKTLDLLKEIEKSRNRIAVLAEERLTNGQWLVMVFLVLIILFSIVFLDRTSFFMQFSAILMSTSLVMVLFIIRDLQNFRFGGKLLMEESGEQVFESIGKLRYYNAEFLKEGTVFIPKHIKKFRLGIIHKNGRRLVKIINR